MFRAAVILCAIAGQVLSVPKPCIDLSCVTYHTQQPHQSSHPQQMSTDLNSESSHHRQKRDQQQVTGKQSEDLSEHTKSTDVFSTKTDQEKIYNQIHTNSKKKESFGHLKLEEMTQQSQDLSEQPGNFGDYPQQASGNLEFGKKLEQQTGQIHFGQHTTQRIEDLSHETEPKLREKGGRRIRSSKTGGFMGAMVRGVKTGPKLGGGLGGGLNVFAGEWADLFLWVIDGFPSGGPGSYSWDIVDK